MDLEELKKILDEHKLWFAEPAGRKTHKRADLHGANLYRADLENVDLRGANLSHANLESVLLCGANLEDANLFGANLRRANLFGVNLRRADLSGANLGGTNLRGADLSGANLRYANLNGADLRGAKIDGVEINENTAFFALQCPERGCFTAYKICDNYIIELEIPAGAKRSSATTRKCRAEAAKVISITNLDGTESTLTSVPSNWDSNFIYTVGETVRVDDFDNSRWNECSNGIHFFITRDEARRYWT